MGERRHAECVIWRAWQQTRWALQGHYCQSFWHPLLSITQHELGPICASDGGGADQ